jgi:hypothetical protein
MSDSIIDCDAGRQLGCKTFCCRLLVRYDENERPLAADGTGLKSCVDKAPDGLCAHLDRETYRCGIWERRPRVCREYTCNDDPMLQAAIRVGVKNIVQLARDSLSLHVPREGCTKVPECGCGCSEEAKNES